MKRTLVWLLIVLTLLSLCSCAAETAPKAASPAEETQVEETQVEETQVEETQVEETQVEETQVEETQAVETPAEVHGQPAQPETEAAKASPLYLKYASVTFSVVGETDDLYLGIAPREEIVWQSDDPDIVSVEQGILTAKAVGSTTIHASCGEETKTCAVECLAETEEDLKALSNEILSAPKRLVPEVDMEAPCTYFDEAAILGDSITYFMMQWEAKSNELGEMTFLTRNGVSLSSFALNSKSIYYRGKETPPEIALAKTGVKQVYILMGSLDMQAATLRPSINKNWHTLLTRIREKCPDIEITLISNIPGLGETAKKQIGKKASEYNLQVCKNNEKMKPLAEEFGCRLLDLYSYTVDHSGQMPEGYSRDSHHLNKKGCQQWMQIMRYYAQFTQDGGSLFVGPAPEKAEAAETETSEAKEQVPSGSQPETALEETQARPVSDKVFLKVSSVNLSLVGDSEDIYLGMVPREDITWESDDPGIISVENGIITANAVGSTLIRASYKGNSAECLAGCLAENQETFRKLSKAVLSAPRRLPPEVDLTQPCDLFDNAALVGDSISYNLMQWETPKDTLGNILFLARGGVSMNGFALRYKNIYYRGKEMNLEDALAKSKVSRVYFLMGSNDIQATTQSGRVFTNWETMLERIREKSPDIEIVVMSNIPQYTPDKPSKYNQVAQYNIRIEEYNETLRQFAADHNCMFLDLHYYVTDHYNRMPEIYHQGAYHMNGSGCRNWATILRYYAQYELEGGTLA